jgi:hypothetical protein
MYTHILWKTLLRTQTKFSHFNTGVRTHVQCIYNVHACIVHLHHVHMYIQCTYTCRCTHACIYNVHVHCVCKLCMYIHVLGHHCGTNVSIAHLPVRTCTWKYSVRWRDLWTLKTWMNWLLRCPWSVTSLHTQTANAYVHTQPQNHDTLTFLHLFTYTFLW